MRGDANDDSSFTSILPFTLEFQCSYPEEPIKYKLEPCYQLLMALVSRAQSPSAFTQCWKSAAVIESHQPFSSTATQTLWVSAGHNRTINLISGCVSKPSMELSQNRDAWIPVPEILIRSSQLRPDFWKNVTDNSDAHCIMKTIFYILTLLFSAWSVSNRLVSFCYCTSMTPCVFLIFCFINFDARLLGTWRSVIALHVCCTLYCDKVSLLI